MTARSILISGLIAGLFAGMAAFAVAHQVGEPAIDSAIAVEEAQDEAQDEAHAEDQDEEELVSRQNQSTWGLLTATVTTGVALGGIVALAAAGVAGRIGQLTAGQSTTLVAVLGFAAVYLVPFLKYPANPPAVGEEDTIGERTGYYFAFLAVSLVATVLATYMVARYWQRFGLFTTLVSAIVGFVIVMTVVANLMPSVNEVGDFPADTLWYFRRAAILTQATLWGVIATILTGAVTRMQRRDDERRARQQVAAAL